MTNFYSFIFDNALLNCSDACHPGKTCLSYFKDRLKRSMKTSFQLNTFFWLLPRLLLGIGKCKTSKQRKKFLKKLLIDYFRALIFYVWVSSLSWFTVCAGSNLGILRGKSFYWQMFCIFNTQLSLSVEPRHK
jgi:hypothetical protein